MNPNKLAEGLLNYAMTGSVSGEELRRFPRVLADALTSSLTRQALALFREDFDEHGSLSADRVYLRANGSGGAVRVFLSNILGRDFPPVEEILTALQRIRETSLEDLQTESGTDLLGATLAAPAEIFAGMLARGEVLTLGGPPKGGKSYFALQGALSAASGGDFLGLHVPHPFKVLYVLAEGSRRRFRERVVNAIAFLPGIEDEDLGRLHLVETKGRLKIDTEAGEKTLIRLVEPFDLVVLDTFYALQGGGDENSHRDFRAISGALDRLKHSGEGKAILLIHHVRKNTTEDAGADELRGAGFSGFSDAVIRLYKRKGKTGVHYELKFDLRNYAEREDLLLTRTGPMFSIADSDIGVTTTHVVNVLKEAGGKIEGREAIATALMTATGLKRQSCLNALGRAMMAGLVGSATRQGMKSKTYYLADNPGGEG